MRSNALRNSDYFVNSVEYGSLPWEKVGTNVSELTNIQDILQKARLDWMVEKKQSYMKVGNEYHPITDNFTLVKEDGQILSPFSGNRYKPIQNQYAFEVFEQFAAAGNMNIEFAGYLNNGQHIWALAQIDNSYELGEELIKGYFLLVQSHRYGHSLRAMFTPIRYPGGHTFVQPIVKNKRIVKNYSMPHSRKFSQDRINEIKEIIGYAKDSLKEYYNSAQYLSKVKVSDETEVLYLAKLFDKRLFNDFKSNNVELPKSVDDIVESKDVNRIMRKVANNNDYEGKNLSTCKGTAWGLYNHVVHALDKGIGRSVDTMLQSSWFGVNSKKKMEAYEQILQMAKVE